MDITGPQDFDLLVIGGGLTGAGIARDAVSRGLAVCLVGPGDVVSDAGAGYSTPETGDTPVALAEYERLRAIAPHCVQAKDAEPRPRWLRALLSCRDDTIGAFAFDAARLAVLTALDAAERGAIVRTRTNCVKLSREGAAWAARLKGPLGVQDITARQVVQVGEGEAVNLDRGPKGQASTLLTVPHATTVLYRLQAEQALAMLGAPGAGWTANAPLPGGDIPSGDYASFHEQQARFFPWLSPANLDRMARAYGARLPRVLGDARGFADLGQHFGGGLTAAEVIYQIHNEFVRSAEDVLRRHSRLASRLSPAERLRLTQWFERVRIDDAAITAAIISARTG